MDPTLIAYSASVFAALLAFSTIAFLGTWELHAQAVPPFLEEQGYTPAIFVNQVTDAVNTIRTETASQIDISIVVAGQITAVGEIESYFGLRDVIRASQASVGLAPPRIDMEIIERDKSAHWLIRGQHAIHGNLVKTGETDLSRPDLLIKDIAQGAVSFISPFEAVGHELIENSKLGRYNETIEQASELLIECQSSQSYACSPDKVQLGQIIRGVAYLNAGQYSSALRDLTDASETTRGSAVATAFIGDVYTRLNESELADENYAHAKDLDAAVSERFRKFGLGLQEAGNNVLADERFRTASRLGAEGPEFLSQWGEILVAVGDLEGALEKYLSAEATDTENTLFAERISDIRAELAKARGGNSGAAEIGSTPSASSPSTAAPNSDQTGQPAPKTGDGPGAAQ